MLAIVDASFEVHLRAFFRSRAWQYPFCSTSQASINSIEFLLARQCGVCSIEAGFTLCKQKECAIPPAILYSPRSYVIMS